METDRPRESFAGIAAFAGIFPIGDTWNLRASCFDAPVPYAGNMIQITLIRNLFRFEICAALLRKARNHLPPSKLPDRNFSLAIVTPMKLIPALLQRMLLPRTPEETRQGARFTEDRDRSSMADLVRILQTLDERPTDQRSA